MSHVIDNGAFDRATDPLFQLLSDEQLRRLSALAPNLDLEDRIGELADRVQEGELSVEEVAEYEGYVRANNLVAVLQGIARRRLTSNAP